jgi:hypothetical protein
VQIDRNRKLTLADVGVRRRLIELRSTSAVAANGQITKVNIEALRINQCAGIANRRRQPSPIRITTRPRRLHQRRMGCGPRRFELPVTVGLLTVGAHGKLEAKIVPLSAG